MRTLLRVKGLTEWFSYIGTDQGKLAVGSRLQQDGVSLRLWPWGRHAPRRTIKQSDRPNQDTGMLPQIAVLVEAQSTMLHSYGCETRDQLGFWYIYHRFRAGV